MQLRKKNRLRTSSRSFPEEASAAKTRKRNILQPKIDMELEMSLTWRKGEQGNPCFLLDLFLLTVSECVLEEGRMRRVMCG